MKSQLIASLTLVSLSLPILAAVLPDDLKVANSSLRQTLTSSSMALASGDQKASTRLDFAPAIPDDAPADKSADKSDKTVKAAPKKAAVTLDVKADKNPKAAKDTKAAAEDKEEKAEKKKKAKAEKADSAPAEPSAEEKEYMEHQAKLAALLKTVKTPFALQSQESTAGTGLSALRLDNTASRPASRLSERLLASRLYMPGRVVIGKQAEFTVKGKPGYWAAVAMADRDSGAKPISGHPVRLGPDRKVVALGQIPAGGVLCLKYWAPVEGDLIGQNLYFEAAVWPDGKPETAEIAQTVSSESQAEKGNAILVTAESEKKKGIRLVPDSAVPMYQRSGAGAATLDAGKF